MYWNATQEAHHSVKQALKSPSNVDFASDFIHGHAVHNGLIRVFIFIVLVIHSQLFCIFCFPDNFCGNWQIAFLLFVPGHFCDVFLT